ncbi:hypothetical protein TPHA_0A00220 [Tetrapisispora phaffii CBS 4417]|uniref:Xylulose kinase n=1 Tax=Tetrapisispora phaffii (strain ATCC 24235 / CBS 4417 / NBRC 1672 / NRRL Y-8282 / UCD 70-5) TaxID=1071381 RepID=G8BMH9_TETPH|nr:hypothetical protein TPHA_0A00220 [Tetrapisispora phaffii CBS 4417]CCE61107.1 hypothetical protein TPHA_0A00220 [Tetrapisispora phaffii CBS 4417]
MTERFYLGFDLSTQQLKCLAINDKLTIVASESVEFDKDLSHYGTEKGIYKNGKTIDAPVAMWFEAIDLIFERYKERKFPLEKVVGISGSCQQHGSVFWSEKADSLLKTLTATKTLVEQLVPHSLTRKTAPNWQDHSTAMQCDEMETAVGGMVEMAQITGSKAHFRFTGPQILKVAEDEHENYDETSCISLVSSFLQSVLCGKLTPLEESDACGMNLYDIENHCYDKQLISLIDSKNQGSDLTKKLLGDPISSTKKPLWTANVSDYFVKKYNVNALCSIYPFTGDNLATICSLPLQKNDVLVSLGTSTTVLLVTDSYLPSPDYHMFIHPTIPRHYMAMICYCNGSLAREKVRDQLNNDNSGSWERFNKEVSSKDDKSSENEIGVYFSLDEIVPSVNAIHKRAKFDVSTGNITEFVDKFENDSKNIVKSQALSCRVRITPLLSNSLKGSTSTGNGNIINYTSEKVKFDFSDLPLSDYMKARPNRVFFVGGAAKNDSLIKKYAAILGAKNGNFRFANTSNSCALGGCYKALWSYLYNNEETTSEFDKFLNEKFNWEELEHFYDSNEEEWRSYSIYIKPLSHLESSLSE